MVMPDEQDIPAEALMGKPLIDADGSPLGPIEDVVLGSDGQAEQIVVSKSGTAGGELVAIDVNATVWQPGLDVVRLTSLTRKDVQAMPEANYDEGMSALDRE
jgi:hypothetical protein